jgi:hypothetical protein
MRLFQDIKEVESYIQEKDEHFRLKEYDFKNIVASITFWSDAKQAFLIIAEEEFFWAIVGEYSYYNLESFNWEEPPVGYEIYGSVARVNPDEEGDLILEYDPEAKKAVLSSKEDLEISEVFEWVTSADPKDWDTLSELFGPNWEKWLQEQSEGLRELYEEEHKDEI